jgi:hypothetical protein
MLSSAIKGGLLAYDFISSLFKMPGPHEDVFSTQLSSSVRNDIASYVSSLFLNSLHSRQPLHSLQSRFTVISIGINKDGMPVQHESLAVWVKDSNTFEVHEFVIQRVPSELSHSARFNLFCQDEDSPKVLESIERAIKNMRSVSKRAAESISAAIRVETEAAFRVEEAEETETFPLLLLTDRGPSTASEREPEHAQTLSPAPHSQKAKSLMDLLTTSLIRAAALARTASSSVSPQPLAVDSISGCPRNTLKLESCIRNFQPRELPLFDLVLLARVVNEYAPIYGLFDNHCYMFASVIFDAVIQLYSRSSTPGPVPAPTPEVGPPGNTNRVFLPLLDESPAGSWAGLLILDPTVKSTIVNIVMSKFTAQRKKYVEDASQ